jgi:FkbM family methyltransferase
MVTTGPAFSGSRFGKWVARRITQSFSPRLGHYEFLSPPFSSQQLVRSRHTGSRINYRVRDKNDLAIANQMFAEEEYSTGGFRRAADIRSHYDALLAAGKTPLILDCGGNIGLSARYFREHYPTARIVAVEPDPANFALMSANIAPAGLVAVNAAVASTSRRGRMLDPGAGGCGMRVEDDPAGDIVLLSIEDLLTQQGKGATPFILKMDIEGFEQDVFAGDTAWLDRFYVAVIELHDWMLPGAASSRPFLSAVAALERDFLFKGENVFSISNREPGP